MSSVNVNPSGLSRGEKAGALAAVCYALGRGAVQVVRVHDVAATRDAVTLFAEIERFANRSVSTQRG